MPSTVVTLAPSTATANNVQLLTEQSPTWTTHAPHWLVSQPTCVPVSESFSRNRSHNSMEGSTSTLVGLPLRTKLMFMCFLPLVSGARGQR